MDSVRKIYRDSGIDDYTYGNAQKITFVASKYLLSSNLLSPDNRIFEYSGIPIDRIVICYAKRHSIVIPDITVWSKCDDKYLIMEFEKSIEQEARKAGLAPLFWECCIWN